MSGAPPLSLAPAGVSAQDAARAYRAVDTPAAAGAPHRNDFAGTLAQTLENAVTSGESAETQAAQAVAGGGDLTAVVEAVSRAELTLQTATAIRDRVVQAYQDIMKMPI